MPAITTPLAQSTGSPPEAQGESIARVMGDFIMRMQDAPLPGELIPAVKTGITDWVAVMVAGWSAPSTRSVRAVFAPASRESAALAAIFGTAAHALDYDDTAFGNHPSAVLVAALLAAAHSRPISGRAMLAAYLAGYEIWADLAAREQDSLHAKGWHPSATLGPIAATAAVACGWGLTAHQAAVALAISASFSGGIVANFGSSAKPFHLGRAAQSGILAVQLARAGMTASADAIEHDHGLLRALSPRGRVDLAVPLALESLAHFRRQGLNIKLSPICYAAHRICDAALMVRADVRPETIARIEIQLGDTQSVILRSHRPATLDEAKFSAEFAAVATLLTGRCGLAELDPDFINRADVQALIAVTVRQTTAAQDPVEPMHAPFDRITLVLRDGTRVMSPAVTHAHGHHLRPASPERLRAKFDECVKPCLAPADAARLFDRLAAIEDEDNIADLLPGLGLEIAA
jgi:2-methylcitrate dehydratase PrpD